MGRLADRQPGAPIALSRLLRIKTLSGKSYLSKIRVPWPDLIWRLQDFQKDSERLTFCWNVPDIVRYMAGE